MIYPEDYDHAIWSLLEEGRIGKWSLIKTVSQPGEDAVCWKEGEGTYRDKYAAVYPKVVLAYEDTIWMMDSPFEQQTAMPAVRGARGRCLVTGLGIGMVPVFFARKPDVKSVRVLELSPEVIELVGSQLLREENISRNPWMRKITIVQGDFWEYAPESTDKFETVQVDIWPTALTAIHNCDRATELGRRLLAEGGDIYCWMAEHQQLMRESGVSDTEGHAIVQQ